MPIFLGGFEFIGKRGQPKVITFRAVFFIKFTKSLHFVNYL